MLSFQQFWTRPSVCICRQIVWTFGAYGLVALIFISGEDVVRHTFASWIFFYCLLPFFLILFLLFIVLQGAVCYPLELRLTRIGLIWHQASVVDFHIVKSTSPPPSRRTCQDVQAVSSGSLAISLTATSTCPGPHSHA